MIYLWLGVARLLRSCHNFNQSKYFTNYIICVGQGKMYVSNAHTFDRRETDTSEEARFADYCEGK